jgi:hypothetical protein
VLMVVLMRADDCVDGCVGDLLCQCVDDWLLRC